MSENSKTSEGKEMAHEEEFTTDEAKAAEEKLAEFVRKKVAAEVCPLVAGGASFRQKRAAQMHALWAGLKEAEEAGIVVPDLSAAMCAAWEAVKKVNCSAPAEEQPKS